MKHFHFPVVRLSSVFQVATVVCAIFSSYADAQATRTWVSGVGDDANPGSRTAPCKTFAGAISKTAAGGEINAIDPGGFGAVTITKSMTIDGQGAHASIFSSGTNGIVINAAATDVVNLRNLSLNGGTPAAAGLVGIRIIAAAEVNIENCTIFNFATRGIEIETSSPCRVNVTNSIIRDCSGGAVFARPNAVITISKCSLIESQFGFRAEGGVTAVVEDSIVSGHTFNGVVVDTSTVAGSASVSLNGCVISDNSLGGIVSRGATSVVRLSNNTIIGNVTGISASMNGALLSFGNNRVFGNTADGAPTGSATHK